MKVSTDEIFRLKITQNRVIVARFSQWYLSVAPNSLEFQAEESVNNFIIKTNGDWSLS